MNQSATYSCTALMGTNKVGVLKPDADGYYEVILGALDFYNSAGAYYPFASAKNLFEESSSFMRRVKTGCLKGEYGHPKFLPGMSKRDFIGRVLNIHEECVSHHIRDVKIETERVKDKNGGRVVAIIGYVKPAGPHGQALKDALENKHENVCFSIRSLTNDVYDARGTLIKHIQQIITWDYVNEPGISVANKYQAPGLEGLENVRFSFENLKDYKEHRLELGVGLENGSGVSPDEVIKSYGWDKPTVSKRVPPSLKW
jgi:hypothetical protein